MAAEKITENRWNENYSQNWDYTQNKGTAQESQFIIFYSTETNIQE